MALSLLVCFCSFVGFTLTHIQHTKDSRNGRLFRAILLSEKVVIFESVLDDSRTLILRQTGVVYPTPDGSFLIVNVIMAFEITVKFAEVTKETTRDD